MKYKIFDHCWHTAHQYDMIHALQSDCDFYYCLDTKKNWDTNQRPVPDVLNFVDAYEPGRYDFAILHIDQQSFSPDVGKQRIYKEFNEHITDIPKIVINHGTPVFPEYFKLTSCNMTVRQMEDMCIKEIEFMVGENTMVVNSHTAASGSEWGFGIPIVHGMDPANWLDLPKEPRVFTALSPLGFDSYYNRECLSLVAQQLLDKYGYKLWHAKVNMDLGNSFEGYREYLGRSLIYLDTSFRTPMNRARTEAFLSGCCVVQVNGAHDLSRWASNGKNILLVPNDPYQIADLIADYVENRYETAIEIGQNGKKMAALEFSPERYRADWLRLFNQLINK